MGSQSWTWLSDWKQCFEKSHFLECSTLTNLWLFQWNKARDVLLAKLLWKDWLGSRRFPEHRRGGNTFKLIWQGQSSPHNKTSKATTKRENDRLKLANYQLKAKCVSQRASTTAHRETLNGVWPRWQNRKTLKLTCSHRHIEIATMYRATIDEKDQNL